MQSKSRLVPLAGVLASTALLLGACASQPEPVPTNAGPNAPELAELTIGYNVPFDPTFLPDLAAFECLEQEKGVRASVREVTGAPASIASLVAGALDITLSTLGSGLNAIAAEQDLVAVVPSASAPYFMLMAPGDVEDWEDLKGLTFGSTAPSDSSYYTTVLLLGAHGIEPEDVQWVTVQGSAARAQAMVAGKIDAGQVTVSEMLEVESQSDKRAFAAVGEDFPDLIFNAYWVKRSFLEQNPNTVRAFVECVMSEHAAAYDEEQFMAKAAELLPGGMDQATLDRAYETLIGMRIWDPEESAWNEESGDRTVQTMVDYGALPGFIPFEDWAETSIVDAVRAG